MGDRARRGREVQRRLIVALRVAATVSVTHQAVLQNEQRCLKCKTHAAVDRDPDLVDFRHSGLGELNCNFWIAENEGVRSTPWCSCLCCSVFILQHVEECSCKRSRTFLSRCLSQKNLE